jgi:phenylacetate-CoA ligase
MGHFDLLEVRSADERATEQFADLRRMLTFALDHAPALLDHFGGIDPAEVIDRKALARLPVLRKANLSERQAEAPPFGGLTTRAVYHNKYAFMSPGPIFEPGSDARDWWRVGRFLHAAGFKMGDVVQNCFSYHLTPAGHMFDSGVAAISATVIPAGTGQTEQQALAASRIGATGYAGTPDFLKVIMEKAEALDLPLKIARAAVSGGALFPSLRDWYGSRGVQTRQCYATAEAGLIAYESESTEGMIVDEGVILEIVRPGSEDPVPDGEVGEVLVTVLNPDYPLVRFATGDLSAVLPGESPCGRTNMRIKGWMGRADQTTKVRGMFVRPEQVAAVQARHPEAVRIRLTVTRENDQDALSAMVETDFCEQGLVEALSETLRETLKLRATVTLVEPGALPNDGKVIDDQRDFGSG